MSGETEFRGYVALCSTCGGTRGMSSRSVEHLEMVGWLAALMADGAVLLPYYSADELKARMEEENECGCPPVAVSHEPSVPDDLHAFCPECDEPKGLPGEDNRCRHCGAEWSRTAVLTVSRVIITKPGTVPDDDEAAVAGGAS